MKSLKKLKINYRFFEDVSPGATKPYLFMNVSMNKSNNYFIKIYIFFESQSDREKGIDIH